MTTEKIKYDPPVKMCEACFALSYAAVKVCPHCANPFPKRAKAPKWRKISENERAIQVGDKHYCAQRCDRSTMWTIEEITAALETGSGRLIAVVASKLTTRDVTRYFSMYG